MGYHKLTGAKATTSNNLIYYEGKTVPRGIAASDFIRAEDGSGFDFKRRITKRTYGNGKIVTALYAEDDDPDANDEDLTADPEKRAGVTDLFIYEWDAPGFDVRIWKAGDVIRRRSNFKVWLEYAGARCSADHNWWERQSLTRTATGADRNNDHDEGTDDDDGDDNNVLWDAVSSLAEDLRAPGTLHHFEVVPTILPVHAGDRFEVAVVAEDSRNDVKHDFTGRVTLSHTGTAGKDGPPKTGVHINLTATKTDDFYGLAARDAGAHSFPIIAYTVEIIGKFTAKGGGKTGSSGPLEIFAPP